MTNIIESLKGTMYLIGQWILFPLLAGVVVGTYHFIANWIKNKQNHSIEFNNSKNVEIQMLLAELRAELNANRAYISLFSNGEKYTTGSPLVKINRFIEVVDIGVSHEYAKWQSINISMISDFLELIIGSKTIKTIEIDQLIDSRFKRLMISQGVITNISLPIFKSNDIIGVLGLDFDKTISDVDTDLIKKKAIVITEKLLV